MKRQKCVAQKVKMSYSCTRPVMSSFPVLRLEMEAVGGLVHAFSPLLGSSTFLTFPTDCPQGLARGNTPKCHLQ